MSFDVRGGPLHTRTLSVTLSQSTPPFVAFTAYVLDLRKRGFAPVGGDLQSTGIIHHMELQGVVDTDSRRFSRMASRMPTVAFEARPATGGDTCREVAGRAALLDGLSIDDDFARGASDAIGGPRGCSHVFTLALLVAPTIRAALALDRAHHGAEPGRRVDERIFRRDVTIDGYELPGRDLLFAAQTNDLLCRPAPELAQAMDRFAQQLELRVAVQTSFEKLVIQSIEAGERRRQAGGPLDVPWADRRERVAGLVGTSMRHGITQALFRHFADHPQDRALLDTLLQFAPTSVQCYAALDLWASRANVTTSATDTGGWPDSCWMWRRDGHMSRWRDQAMASAQRPRATDGERG